MNVYFRSAYLSGVVLSFSISSGVMVANLAFRFLLTAARVKRYAKYPARATAMNAKVT